MEHQIFISYRRDGGDFAAKLICEALKNHGYTVFYDYDSLKGGFFDSRILKAIEACTDVVLVLPKNALRRCKNEDDWLRREIGHALKHGKNIIPVMIGKFEFPKKLPEDIQSVARCNGVRFHMDCFDAMIDLIIEKFSENTDSEETPAPTQSDTENSRRGSKAASPCAPTSKPRPMIIRNVCSLGSCDFEHAYPKDGYYTEVIDRDRFQVVYFHLSTAKIPDRSKVRIGMTIYNSKGQQVFDNVGEFDWQPSFDAASLSWVIRGNDNSFVSADVYRAEFWIEDSDVYEYTFKVTSSAHERIVPQDPIKLPRATPPYFKMLLLQAVSYVLFLAAVSFAVNDGTVGALIAGILCIASIVVLFRMTRKYVTANWFLVGLLVTVASAYYGIYLLVMGIVHLFKRA
jgi:hypothetical protein